MYKLIWSFLICAATAWIAGYMAIVIPIITKDSAPANLGGNFNIWADCGWIFMALIVACSILIITIDAKRRSFLRCLLPMVLIISIPIFQYYAARDTARVSELFAKRTALSSKHKTQDKITVAFDIAHKKSEKNIKILVIILLAACAGGMYSIASQEPENND